MLGLFQINMRAAVEEPKFWLVAFHEAAGTPWVNWVPGRFKHVSLVAYFHGAKSWVVYDPALVGTRVVLYADTNAGLNELGTWLDDALVVRMPARCQDVAIMYEKGGSPLGFWGRLGFWCVPAVRHALGLRSRALLPDRLLRDCLNSGGTIAMQPGSENHDVHAEAEARSGA